VCLRLIFLIYIILTGKIIYFVMELLKLDIGVSGYLKCGSASTGFDPSVNI
jgi:hypothetical protein